MWKFEDGKLINYEKLHDWKFGSNAWIIDEDGFIVEENSKKVLDISGGGTNRGTDVILYGRHGGENQKWDVKDSGWMRLKNHELHSLSGCKNKLFLSASKHDELTTEYDYLIDWIIL